MKLYWELFFYVSESRHSSVEVVTAQKLLLGYANTPRDRSYNLIFKKMQPSTAKKEAGARVIRHDEATHASQAPTSATCYIDSWSWGGGEQGSTAAASNRG